MEIEFEPEDECLLFEIALEEIALEGLDGITLQGLLIYCCSLKLNSIVVILFMIV